jgi:hypothetical protein
MGDLRRLLPLADSLRAPSLLGLCIFVPRPSEANVLRPSGYLRTFDALAIDN